MCCEFVLLLFNGIMSWSLVLPQLESVMSVTYGATKGRTNVWNLDCFLCLCWCPSAAAEGYVHVSMTLL